MIFVSSLIEGFKVTLGSLPVQASMLTILLALINPGDDYKKVYWVLAGSHTFCLFLVVANMIKPTHKFYMGLRCLNIIAMFLQNIVIIYAAQSYTQLKENREVLTDSEIELSRWLLIEVYVFIAYIISAILFLLVRSCLRH